MELKPSIKLSNQLKLSPRLYQSLKILRMNAPDLLELIQTRLDENPTLEMPEPGDFDLDLSRPDGGFSAEQELWRDLAAANSGEAASQGRRDPLRTGGPLGATDLTASPVTLSDHLCLQIDLLRLPKRQHRAALAVIGSLDDDGYFRESLPDLAAALGFSHQLMEQALKTVQSLDPPGIAARSLEECLIIQLKQMNSGGLSRQLVQCYLPQLARSAYSEIAKDAKVSIDRVKKAAATVRSLNPSPGSLFDLEAPAARIIPDVYVNRQQGQTRILANREILPSLQISEMYRQIANRARSTGVPVPSAVRQEKSAASGSAGFTAGIPDEQAISYIRKKIREASGLIRDINQRRTTVTKVAQAIIESQPEFLEKGPDYLLPLTLEDVARKLDVHPSTISRAILGKYMSTPQGIFEFRYFFSAGFTCDRASGKGIAATAVKKRLQKMIKQEDQRRPYSDQKLTDMLRDADIPISRRTVAKYREEIGIAPSWDRKNRSELKTV